MKPFILLLIILLGATIEDCLEEEPPPNPNEDINSILFIATWDVISFTEDGLVRDLSNTDISIVFDRTGPQSGVMEWYSSQGGQIDTIYRSEYFIFNEGTCIELGNDKMDISVGSPRGLLNMDGELDGNIMDIVAQGR